MQINTICDCCCITGASFFFRELVDEDADSDGMNGLGGNEEVVVIVDDDSQQHQRRHPRHDGEEGLHLWRLSPDPQRHCVDRPLRCPHRLSIYRCGGDTAARKLGEKGERKGKERKDWELRKWFITYECNIIELR